MDDTITAYEEQHYFENQTNVVEGIAVDPVFRDDFFSTEHELRDSKELADWWGRPFIETVDFVEDSYASYCERMREFNTDYEVESLEAFTVRREEDKASWNKHWVGGVRYDVRCLTGGAWDRPSLLGQFASLEEALVLAKEEPMLYQELRVDGSLDYPSAVKDAMIRLNLNRSDVEV